MATQTVDSHQTSTSDEQAVKLSSEAVKAEEQINISSPQDSVEDDREKGKADKLQTPDLVLSTSEEKTEGIQVEPPLIEVKKTDDSPVVDIPVHDKESIHDSLTSTVVEVVATIVENQQKEHPSIDENSKIVDATTKEKSSSEDQLTAEFIAREALEVPATTSAEKVQEQAPEAVDVTKSEVKSSDDTVDDQPNEQPLVAVQSVIGGPEKLEILPVPAEKVEDKEPQVIDNPELSVGPTVDSGKCPAKEQPDIEFVSVEKEQKEQIEILPAKEPVEVIAQEIIETDEPPTEKKQPTEVHPVKGSGKDMAKENSEAKEVPKEKEGSEVHPVQESREVIAQKISEEVHPAKELVLVAKGTSESIEPPKSKEQPDVLPEKESQVIAKEISASFKPPKNKEPTDEGFQRTKSGEVEGNYAGGSADVEKHEPEVIEVKDGIGELPEIINQVQKNYVEVETRAIVKDETVKDEKALAPTDDISAPLGGGQINVEEAHYTVESDEQDSVGQVAQPGSTTDSGKGPAMEQPAIESVSIEKEPMEEPETTPVPQLSVEPPKREEQPIEVLPVKEPEGVIAKEIIETVEPPTEKKHPIEVHPVEGSGEVMAKEITGPIELLKEREKATEVDPVQESNEVIAEEISESVEAHPAKEKEAEVIAKDFSASFEPPKDKGQSNEGFPVTESGEVNGKETSGFAKVEKQEHEVIESKGVIEELPEITNQVQNDSVEVETEAIVKGDTLKDEKALATRDDISPPLGGGQIYKEEEQYTVESDKQDSVGEVAQPTVELAAGEFSLDVEETTSKGNEKKESSDIEVITKLSKEEATTVEKVGEENKGKIVKTDKEDEDEYEKAHGSTLPTEEEAAIGSVVAAKVAEKSIDDKNTGKEDHIAETKIEESMKEEKPALVETGNAEHVKGKFDVNETPKEFQESEVEIKDKETVITGVEIPKSNIQDKDPSKKEGDEIKLSQNLQKEVPSKPNQKQSHNILSKVKQSLVKAKKAIIGKSPSSKTISSEARDDIKVK